MTRFPRLSLSMAAVVLAAGTQALATIPYTPVTPDAFNIGPSVPKPDQVMGKEYSHDFDQTTAGLGGGADPQQVIQWDGIGGTTDGLDFTATRPMWTPDQEIDAIANHNDFLFQELFDDVSHLIFSHDDEVSGFLGPVGHFPVVVPSGGPVLLSNGNTIGGAGEVSIEKAGFFHLPETQDVWATQPEVNGMPLPRDVDGLEVWGVEPVTAALLGDTDKYSLDLDVMSGVSVWNASGTPYIPHAAIVSTVTSLLGPLTGAEMLLYDQADGEGVINLDALMVNDIHGDIDTFDVDPTSIPGLPPGASDSIIFSIRQVIDPTDPDGYYATGSELFFLNGDGTFGFLAHGGHAWDHSYALSSLRLGGPNGQAVIDINAIEAITQVPEPAGIALLLCSMGSVAAMRWRLG